MAEQTIEKSRFLAYLRHVENEEEAREFLKELHAMHPQATHICYGFIADEGGILQRFSDDGEPQGTAGMPILGVLKAQKLYKTALAVVRYFGGIKLGAGGLTRAYSSSAAMAVSAGDIREYDSCLTLCVKAGYSDVSAVIRFLEREGAEFSQQFQEEAVFTFSVREEGFEGFQSRFMEFFSGKLPLNVLGRSVYPFSRR